MIRDRIRELRRVKANELRRHAKNWRIHPPNQREAMQGVLEEIGYAGALVAWERPDGTLELIDGHLRAETTPNCEVPVLILDVNEQEANKLLAVFDPLSSVAEVDTSVWNSLLRDVETDNRALEHLLVDWLDSAPVETKEEPSPDRHVPINPSFQVVVECADENEQRDVYERLSRDGHPCRVLTL